MNGKKNVEKKYRGVIFPRCEKIHALKEYAEEKNTYCKRRISRGAKVLMRAIAKEEVTCLVCLKSIHWEEINQENVIEFNADEWWKND